MKKVFAVCAIALAFVACNDDASTKTSTEDSIRQADSLRAAQASQDSLNALQAAPPVADSVKVDSVKADSVKVK